MRRVLFAAPVLTAKRAFVALVLLVFSSAVQADPPTLALANGRFFDGSGFVKGSWYVRDGALLRTAPEHIDLTIDLQGRFVIPPFGDAHQHALNDPAKVDSESRAYLARGTYYVMVQDAMVPVADAVRARVNRADAVDVTWTRSPLVGPLSGLRDFFVTLAGEGLYGAARTVQELDGLAFFTVSSEADVERICPEAFRRNPDFVKVILAFSEEHRQRARFARDPGRTLARPGLDPSLLPSIVRRAHTVGRRVSAHVETAADFRVAVQAGADIVAHLPGWQIGPSTAIASSRGVEPWRLTDADAREAARRGVVVVTTALPHTYLPDWQALVPDWDALHRHNLRLLAKHGVRIAIGSDRTEEGPLDEALYLARLGVLDNRALLRALVEDTPRLVFPARRFGRLEEGAEASLLVLDGDPLQDLAAARRIVMRMKQGRLTHD